LLYAAAITKTYFLHHLLKLSKTFEIRFLIRFEKFYKLLFCTRIRIECFTQAEVATAIPNSNQTCTKTIPDFLSIFQLFSLPGKNNYIVSCFCDHWKKSSFIILWYITMINMQIKNLTDVPSCGSFCCLDRTVNLFT